MCRTVLQQYKCISRRINMLEIKKEVVILEEKGDG